MNQARKSAKAIPAGAARTDKGVDLADLDTVAPANDGAEMSLRHPATQTPLHDENGREVTITLAGIDSDAFRKAQRAAINKRIANGGRTKILAEEYETEQIEMLIRCTLTWHGIVLDGEKLECTATNARRLYQALPWVREQADQFIADRANFIRS